jgi:RNA polymerase sigma factor (sigma-70 family)
MREGGPLVAPASSDAELAVRLRAGDTDALGELYDRHVRGLHDFLARFTGDPAGAEDLAHSTFLRAWERRETLRDPSKVRAWLYATAHNLALNHVTRARGGGSLDDEHAAGRLADSAPGPEDEALSRDIADLVWAAASSLEARQYAVLDLSVRRGLTTREIADVLDVPVAHAAVLLNRAREALGNAVRYLLVARRREHCQRLAELVPAGVRALTAQQRSAIDHHMRRCEACRELGERLTTPAQLLGALVPLPLPGSLGDTGRDRLVAAVHSLPAGSAQGGGRWPPSRLPWDGRRWLVGLAGLLVLLLLGGGVSYLTRQSRVIAGDAATPASIGPAVVGTPSPSDVPSPGPSPSPAIGALGTPRPSPAATVAPMGAPGPSPSFGVDALTVTWLDQAACPRPAGTAAVPFTCHFRVTVRVANGPGVVTGTLTATSHRSKETGTARFRLDGTTSVDVSVTFKSCPSGTASATTTPPSASPSNTASFGGPCLT